MNSNPFRSRIILDTGISMGDEGKGRLIPELIRELQKKTGQSDPVATVIKVNGGANSGHTSGGLKLNLFPAGVVERSVNCLAIGSGVVADPFKFLWEGAYIEQSGFPIWDRLLIDERTMVSDFSHRLLDLGWEHYRAEVLGEERRGSTARGISPAYTDETSHFPIYFSCFRNGRDEFAVTLRNRMRRTCRILEHVCEVSPEHWHEFFRMLSDAEMRAHRPLIEAGIFAKDTFDFTRYQGNKPFTLDEDLLIGDYWKAGQQLLAQIGDVREKLLEDLRREKFIIGEFGQAFWLDKRFGFAPNVTASHTLPAEFFLSAGLPVQPVHIIGVCKAYDTKVGTHTFACRFPPEHPLGQKLSQLEFGVTTGRQRMVGWFDAVEKGDALRYGGYHDLVINKLDALSFSGDWQSGQLLICTHYQIPDGETIRHVPRSMEKHRRIRPVFRELPGWTEDISSVRTFDNLPKAAKAYVGTLVKCTFEVAYGLNTAVWPKDLPGLRYIGVGPDPDQIIADVPSVRELLKLAV